MNRTVRLDLSFLEQALRQFDTALAEYKDEPNRRANRDSVNMHFLFTWELSMQAIKRFLELESIKAPELPLISFQTMIRRADALGIVRTGWPGFGEFRDARNAIAHSYDQEKALAVAAIAVRFAEEAHALLENLKGRPADGE